MPAFAPSNATPSDVAAFGSATENAVLRRRISDEIGDRGRISFRRFMELALYDPEEGYYATREAIGPRGDYLTSPELHPLFGALIARQLGELWRLLDRPDPFVVLEAGAGSGALARAILAAPGDRDLADALRYTIVEPRPRLAAAQRATLGALAERVRWHDALAAAGDGVACVLSNELIDSFAVHRVRVVDGHLREIFVAEASRQLVDVLDEPSTPALPDYFTRLGLLPGEGCEAEVNLDTPAWLADAAARIARGFVLTLDYGYPAKTLFAPWRRQGTLLGFYHHTVSTDPYAHLGRQDISAHVDFTSFALAGREAGLEPLGFTSQQRFLDALGVAGALAGGPAAAASLEEYLSRRRAVEALLDPQGLGRVRVLVQGKSAGRPRLTGFPAADEESLI